MDKHITIMLMLAVLNTSWSMTNRPINIRSHKQHCHSSMCIVRETWVQGYRVYIVGFGAV